MIIKCAWCGKPLGEKEPLEDKSVSHGICEKCAKKVEEEADDPGPAPAQMIDVLTDGNAIRTPYGMCSPGFSRDNPPWRGGGGNF